MQIEIIEHRATDRNHQDEATVVWYGVDCGDDVYTGEYGVVFHRNGAQTLVNCDGERVSSANSWVYGKILDSLVPHAKKELEG